ncbi:MAG: rRNA maturation RNase YbeY [Rickettsiales bacterium]|nr:rRNA maturation RNase YbeY [Rickettsiales bacterium]
MQVKIERYINSLKWKQYKDITKSRFLEEIVSATILGSKYSDCFEDVEVAIIFTNNEEIRKVNKDFRGKDKATNVISMQLEEFDGYVKKEYVFLGELVLSVEKIEEEVQIEGKTFFNHCSHLIVHGILHLMGYDHQVDSEQHLMEMTEVKILNTLDISSPYGDKT